LKGEKIVTVLRQMGVRRNPARCANLERQAALGMPIVQEGPLRAPPVHNAKLTGTREITPCKWGHPMRSGRVGGLSLRLSLSAALSRSGQLSWGIRKDVSIISESARQ
jgi:hypothetical protein